jgi:hypothetical protein
MKINPVEEEFAKTLANKQPPKESNFPFNIFGKIKVKEKINYVDLFKDFKGEPDWKTRLKNSNRIVKVRRLQEERDKENKVFDKCIILKNSLRKINRLDRKKIQHKRG